MEDEKFNQCNRAVRSALNENVMFVSTFGDTDLKVAPRWDNFYLYRINLRKLLCLSCSLGVFGEMGVVLSGLGHVTRMD